MSDEAVAGPSGIKRPRRAVEQRKNVLSHDKMMAYLEDSDGSLEDVDFGDVSGDDESYLPDCDSDQSDDLPHAEQELLEEDPLEEPSQEIHDVVWSDPPLINRQHLSFTEPTGLLQQPQGVRPIDYFNLLVTDDFFNLIVTETNNYAEKVFLESGLEQARITQWKPLTKEELRVFLGLFLHTGTIIIHRMQDYWKKHRLYNLTGFSENMSRNRFLLILRCLHFAGEVAPTVEPPDRLQKIRPILDYFNNKMLEVKLFCI